VPAGISGAKAAEMIPGARYVEYDGAPHGLFVTDQDKLNADLLDFIQS
jgi:non-heme chloroperoxidase